MCVCVKKHTWNNFKSKFFQKLIKLSICCSCLRFIFSEFAKIDINAFNRVYAVDDVNKLCVFCCCCCCWWCCGEFNCCIIGVVDVDVDDDDDDENSVFVDVIVVDIVNGDIGDDDGNGDGEFVKHCCLFVDSIIFMCLYVQKYKQSLIIIKKK